MDSVLVLLYNKFDGEVSRPDLVRIFIALGGDAGGGGGVVGVGVGGV